MEKEFLGLGKTVWFALVATGLTWLGIWLNMFDASLWGQLLTVALPSLAAKSIGSKVVSSIQSKRAGK